MATANLPDDIPVLTDPAARRLNQRQQLDYTNHRETLLQWLLHLGKDPRNATGYSKSTVKQTGTTAHSHPESRMPPP